MDYTYEILSLPSNRGWKLILLEDKREVNSLEFVLGPEDEQTALNWWHALTDEQRDRWKVQAASSLALDVRQAYRLDEAYEEAYATGEVWVGLGKSWET